jgi:hypothetical protein
MKADISFEQQSKCDPSYKFRVVRVFIEDIGKIIWFSQIIENDEIVFEKQYLTRKSAIKKAKEFDDPSWFAAIELLKSMKGI